ncbi:MAG TPA: hypothetical protein VF202_15060, partial [Trueperaceae bacterium]
PSLPSSGASDFTIPAAPTFTGFSVGAYQSGETNTTKAAIRAQWDTPLNLDGSTITDGDHYEIRHRTSHYIGYKVRWGKLAGYQQVFQENFLELVSGGWPTGWTNEGGNTFDYGAGNGIGFHICTNTNVSRRSFRGNVADAVLTFDVSTDTLASGAAHYAAGMLRYTDGNNFYMGVCRFGTDQTIIARILKRVGGAETILGSVTIPNLTHSIGTWYRVKFQVDGDTLSLKIWAKDWEAEPSAWNVVATDGTFTGPGPAGVRSFLVSGNTSGTTKFSYANVKVLNLAPGSGFKWSDLQGNRWGALISEPVSVDPQWQTSYVGWGTNAFTLLELTPGMTYELQIRAADNAVPPHFGPWSDSSFVTTTGDIFAPSTPAPPEVASSMIAIQVTHNLGRNSGGTFNLEPDLDHLDVHVGVTENFYPDKTNKVGELIATPGMIQAGIPAVGT